MVEKDPNREFLVGQRLGLCVFTAEGMGSIPGQGTKILQAMGLRGEGKNLHKVVFCLFGYARKKQYFRKVPEILPPPFHHCPPASPIFAQGDEMRLLLCIKFLILLKGSSWPKGGY